MNFSCILNRETLILGNRKPARAIFRKILEERHREMGEYIFYLNQKPNDALN